MLRPEDWDELAQTGTEAGKFTKACVQKAWAFCKSIGLPGVAMHDACPVMYLAHPEFFRAEEAGVYVETRGSITRGKTCLLYTSKQMCQPAFIILHSIQQVGTNHCSRFTD